MSIWFEGEVEIECSLRQVKESFDHYGDHFVEVVRFMPGLTSVDLVEAGEDFVTIRTNEGLMKRTHISKHLEADNVVVEYDESYQAGSSVTVETHYRDEFTTSESGVIYQAVLSGVEAGGFIGFLYRNLGKSSIGNAVLKANKSYFESLSAG